MISFCSRSFAQLTQGVVSHSLHCIIVVAYSAQCDYNKRPQLYLSITLLTLRFSSFIIRFTRRSGVASQKALFRGPRMR